MPTTEKEEKKKGGKVWGSNNSQLQVIKKIFKKTSNIHVRGSP